VINAVALYDELYRDVACYVSMDSTENRYSYDFHVECTPPRVYLRLGSPPRWRGGDKGVGFFRNDK